VSKLHDDAHFNNATFCNVVNLMLVMEPGKQLVSNNEYYQNPILRMQMASCKTEVSVVSVPLLTLEDLNVLEDMFLEKITGFNLFVHRIDCLPIVHCRCDLCQPFERILEVMQVYAQKFVKVTPCLFGEESTYEYVEFTKYIHEWLTRDQKIEEKDKQTMPMETSEASPSPSRKRQTSESSPETDDSSPVTKRQKCQDVPVLDNEAPPMITCSV